MTILPIENQITTSLSTLTSLQSQYSTYYTNSEILGYHNSTVSNLGNINTGALGLLSSQTSAASSPMFNGGALTCNIGSILDINGLMAKWSTLLTKVSKGDYMTIIGLTLGVLATSSPTSAAYASIMSNVANETNSINNKINTINSTLNSISNLISGINRAISVGNASYVCEAILNQGIGNSDLKNIFSKYDTNTLGIINSKETVLANNTGKTLTNTEWVEKMQAQVISDNDFENQISTLQTTADLNVTNLETATYL